MVALHKPWTWGDTAGTRQDPGRWGQRKGLKKNQQLGAGAGSFEHVSSLQSGKSLPRGHPGSEEPRRRKA